MVKSSSACLICNAPAKHASVRAGDSIEIHCSDCGPYQASNTFREIAARHSKDVRRQSLERARMRARYGLMPMITTYDLP